MSRNTGHFWLGSFFVCKGLLERAVCNATCALMIIFYSYYE